MGVLESACIFAIRFHTDDEHRALTMAVQETARLSREIRDLEREAAEAVQSVAPLAPIISREDLAEVRAATTEQPEVWCVHTAHNRARMATEALSVLVRLACCA